MLEHYIEVDGVPVREPDSEKYYQWRSEVDKKDGRRVARTNVGNGYVSTVFLGTDHSIEEGKFELYETMVFGIADPLGDECWRYATREEAAGGHLLMVEQVKVAIAKTESGK